MKVLLVEDSASDEILTLRALEKAKVPNGDVVVMRDGTAALQFLRDAPTLPDLVLLDLNLPKLGGLEVLSRIRADESTRRLPVVILTSSTEDADILDGYGFGANTYVVKPVDAAQFTDSVRQLGLEWRER
jgi:two-component system response regulator